MKFIRLRRFHSDFQELPVEIQDAAKKAFSRFRDNPHYPYHPSLRIKKMQGHHDIWEGHVTGQYVFTFQISEDAQGEPAIIFRRIGTHRVYKNP